MRQKRSACLILAAALSLASLLPASAAKNLPEFNKILAKGYADLSMGNSQEAANFFASKCEKYPNSGACHTALGKALKRLGKLDNAKDEFRKATEVEPTFADGFYELGVMLESDKDWAGAAKNFEKYQ